MYETISVLLLMQSYDDFHSIPRIFTDSSPTCMDKRLNLGQIGEKDQKVVQTFPVVRPIDSVIAYCG